MGQYTSSCSAFLDENESLLFFTESTFDENNIKIERILKKDDDDEPPLVLLELLKKYNCSTFLDNNESLLFFTDEMLSSAPGRKNNQHHYHTQRITEFEIGRKRLEYQLYDYKDRKESEATSSKMFREKLMEKIIMKQRNYINYDDNYEESRDDQCSVNKNKCEERVNKSNSNFYSKGDQSFIEKIQRRSTSHSAQYNEVITNNLNEKIISSHPINDDSDNSDDESTEIGLNSIGSYSFPSCTSSTIHRFVLIRKRYQEDGPSSPTIHTNTSYHKQQYNDDNVTDNINSKYDHNLTYSFSFEPNVDDDDFFSLEQNNTKISPFTEIRQQNKNNDMFNQFYFDSSQSANCKKSSNNNAKFSILDDSTTTPTTTASYSSSADEHFYIIKR